MSSISILLQNCPSATRQAGVDILHQSVQQFQTVQLGLPGKSTALLKFK